MQISIELENRDAPCQQTSFKLDASSLLSPTFPVQSTPLNVAFHRGADPVSANTEISLSSLKILRDTVANETMLSSPSSIYANSVPSIFRNNQ